MAEIWIRMNQGDTVQALQEALSRCGEDDVIRFEKGEYHFRPTHAFEKYYYISNNRRGLKRVACPVIGKKHVEIDGGGSMFIYHGEIIPFVIEDSESVVLKNFSIDWARPFYSQGTVVRVDERSVDLAVDERKYPYHIENGIMVFEGEGWARSFSEGLFEMDPVTRAPAYLSGDSMGAGMKSDWRVEEVSGGVIRIHEAFPRPPKVGNIVLLRHYRRCCPGIHLKTSKDTTLENVTLHHAGGMGVIAQFCENVTVQNCRVTPSGERLFSVTVDATHFVNCKGLIRLQNCLFENQLDDPANIHGINYRISEIVDDRSLIAELVHHEQHGVEIAFPGDLMQVSDNRTMLPAGTGEVVGIERINERFSKIVFRDALPSDTIEGWVLENLSWTPNLCISGSTARNNRARGFLISTPGRVVVESNRIACSGAGIKISGDANRWFESGSVRDVLILNNHFMDCCYGAPEWGRAMIDIDPEIRDPERMESCFHQNIRIENNRFLTFDTGILYARSVEGITFRGNEVRRSQTYPPTARMEALLTFEACREIRVEHNLLEEAFTEALMQEVEVVVG